MVRYLIAGHDEVDDTEIILEAVAHKDGARVHDEAQLLIRGLERGQVLRAEVGVQVTGLDTGELGQVVHHLQQRSTQCSAVYSKGLSHETDLVGPYLLKSKF